MSSVDDGPMNLGTLARSRRWQLGAGILIILVAFALRVPFLQNIPPGLFFDESTNGLDALRVLRGQAFPVFFEANAGREPLFIYLQAAALGLFGDGAFSLRIVAAFAGILTVAALIPFARVLSADLKRPQLIALLAAAGLATSFWHLNFSRLGLRAILLPLLAILSFYFFWRGRTSGRTRDWILSGLFLGLSLYTYISARFLPIVYGVFFVTEILDRPRGFVAWLRKRALLFATALVVFIPLGLYFVSEPGAFFGRASDVVAQGTSLSTNLLRVAGMFFVRGDLEWRHNLAGRPVLDWIAIIPFLVGLVASVAMWKKPAARLVWIWLVVMLLPSVLSQGAPDMLRAIGALPMVYLMIAWGWDALLTLVARVTPRTQSVAALAALVLTLLGSGWITSQDYFVRWANDRHTFNDFEGGMTDLANWLSQATLPTYLPLELYSHPTVQFLTASRFHVSSFSSADDTAIVHEGGQVVAPDLTNTSGAFVLLRAGQAILLNPVASQNLTPTSTVPGRHGAVASIAPVTGDAFGVTRPVQMTPINARFEDHLTLLGYNLNHVQNKLDVTLYWQAEAHSAREPRIFVHLLDADGGMAAQADDSLTGGVSPLDWPLNQVLPDRHVLELKDNVLAEHPSLELGLTTLFDGDRVNVSLADGTADDHIVIGPLNLPKQ